MSRFFKKIALVLAFVMVFTAMPISAFATDNSFQYPSGYYVDWGFEYGNGVEDTNSSKEVKALIWLNGVQVTDFTDYTFEIGEVKYNNQTSTLATLSNTPQNGVFTFSAGAGYTDPTAYYPGVEIYVTVKYNGTAIVNDANNEVLPINVNIGPQTDDGNSNQGGNLEWISGGNGFEVKDTDTTTFYIDTTNVLASFANAAVRAFYVVEGQDGPTFNELSGCYELVNDSNGYGIKLDGAEIAKALPREFSMFVIQAELRDANGIAVAANTTDVNLVRTPSIFQTAGESGFILANGTAIMEQQWVGEIDSEAFVIVAENGTNDAVHQNYLEDLYEAIWYGEDTSSVYFNTLRNVLNNWDGDDIYTNSQYDGGAIEIHLEEGEDDTGDDFKNHTLEELGKNTMAIMHSGMYLKVGILDREPSVENPDEWVDLTTFDYSEKYTHPEELTFYAYIPNSAIEDCGGIENVTLYCYDGRTDYGAVYTTVAGENMLKFTTASPMEYYFVCWNDDGTGGEGESSSPVIDTNNSVTNNQLYAELNKDVAATIGELETAGNLTSEEAIAVRDALATNAESVTVEFVYDTLNFDDIDVASYFTPEELTQIELMVEVANGQVITGMDIAVGKVICVDGQPVGNPKQLSELPSPVEFTVNLDADAVGDVPQGKQIKWVMYRNHNGAIDKLPVTDNGDGTGTFKTDKFSFYILGYEFIEVQTDTAHSHVWGYNTQFDAAAHWDYCHVCGEKGTVVPHSDEDNNGLCICGLIMSTTAGRANPNTGVTAEMLGR